MGYAVLRAFTVWQKNAASLMKKNTAHLHGEKKTQPIYTVKKTQRIYMVNAYRSILRVTK